MNQHRLVMSQKVIEWDYSSNQDQAPEDRLLYMLFYQMSRMCREKGAVKFDDRLDCMAQGVKYFTDSMGISAYEAVKMRRQEDWQDIMDSWTDDPKAACNHLAFGFDINQRRQARGISHRGSFPTWVKV